ncbi:hypothetical protein [Amycolatopsis sp. WAC 04182]|uniref:hypothetical protein n=1 Tax=Amycolatopsis sp. WAC 04182 TaxID=2203198 RepID=UPI0018F7C593|nr:hypothetical protein [Amycolatopsis sp. WAC 04182]
MKLPDRDRIPIRFAVLTLVTGGLILTGVLAMIRSDVLIAKVPASTLLVAGVLAAAPLLRRVPSTRRTRQAFLVTSAFRQKYWIAGLVQRLHCTLDRADIDLVLKVPEFAQFSSGYLLLNHPVPSWPDFLHSSRPTITFTAISRGISRLFRRRSSRRRKPSPCLVVNSHHQGSVHFVVRG